METVRSITDLSAGIWMGTDSIWTSPNVDDIFRPSPESPGQGGVLRIPVLPQLETSSPIWHYTGGDALISILRTGKLRASSTSMMNDRREIEYGFSVFEEELKRMRADASPPSEDQFAFSYRVIRRARKLVRENRVFVVCASLKANSLSQWRAYGDYAIGLSINPSLLPVAEQFIPMVRPASQFARWTRVMYRRKDWGRWVSHALRLIMHMTPYPGKARQVALKDLEDNAVSHLLWVLPYIKHGDFREEAEVRSTYIVPKSLDTLLPRRYRHGTWGVIAFIDVANFIEPDDALNPERIVLAGGPTIDRLPVTHIYLSPTLNEKSSRASLKSMLRQFAVGGVRVVSSSTPYRK